MYSLNITTLNQKFTQNRIQTLIVEVKRYKQIFHININQKKVGLTRFLRGTLDDREPRRHTLKQQHYEGSPIASKIWETLQEIEPTTAIVSFS